MAKTLIAFFSRADENYFGGAMRYVKVGNTEIVAEIMKELTGADTFKIEMKEPYSPVYMTCIDQAKKDLRDKARPELVSMPESIDAYDTIVLAYPNYWGTMPMAVYTFLEHFDLTGKKISVQSGTTAEEYCLENGYDVSAFGANSDAQAALTTAKVDAWVIDDLTAAEMVKAYNAEHEDQLVILDEPMTTEPYAFAFTLGNDELVGEINKIVNEMVADGTVKSIFDKYEAPYTSPQSK